MKTLVIRILINLIKIIIIIITYFNVMKLNSMKYGAHVVRMGRNKIHNVIM
jgi:hypothetical protein